MSFDIVSARAAAIAASYGHASLISQWELIWHQLEWEKLQADIREQLGDPREVSAEFNDGMRAGVKLAEQIYLMIFFSPTGYDLLDPTHSVHTPR